MTTIKTYRMMVAVAALLSVAVPRLVSAAPVLGPIYDSFSNTNLYLVQQGTWTQAETEAQALGGDLMTIHSNAEQQFIESNVLVNFIGSGGPDLSHLPLWIGLYDPISNDGTGATHAANFVWADGSTSTFRAWNTASGEPSNSTFSDPAGEHYTAINWHFSANLSPPGTWNDAPLGGTSGFGTASSQGPYYGIAAVPAPEPPTFVLTGMGFVGLGFAALRKKCRRA
jgi:hypothetical protein